MSLPMPELPYAGTSGFSGSDTSEARAREQDSNGTTSIRQRKVLDLLSWRGAVGITWRELAEELKLHHGSASGLLSVLHLTGHITRLKSSRNKSKIYVLPEFVRGRDIEPHGKKKKSCPHCGGIL